MLAIPRHDRQQIGLAIIIKNERANLSKAERNDLADLVDVLISAWFVE